MGCTAPQINCPTPIAKLIVTMPSPVEVFSGETNSPSDWRAPIVTISIAAAASVRNSQGGSLLLSVIELSLLETFSLNLRHDPPNDGARLQLIECAADFRQRPLLDRDGPEFVLARERNDLLQLVYAAEVRTLDRESALNRRYQRQRNLPSVETDEDQPAAFAQNGDSE